MSDATSTTEALRQLGTACMAIYSQASPANTLYERACRATGDRAAALLRHYVEPEGAEVRMAIPADDRELFLVAGQDCLRLAAMAQGLAALDAEDVRAIAERPRFRLALSQVVSCRHGPGRRCRLHCRHAWSTISSVSAPRYRREHLARKVDHGRAGATGVL